MTSIRWKAFVLLTLISIGAGTLAWAQDQSAEDGTADGTSGTNDDANSVVSGKPFVARISIDSHTPVAYGDDVIISVWITPREDLDLQYVRLHPKGDLAAIYKSTDQLPLIDPKDTPVKVSGANCRVGTQGFPKGEPFVAVCELTNLSSGWRRWLDRRGLISSGRQQVEIEIGLQNGPDETSTYYEFASLDFVSPKLAVVLGGFFGAFVFSLITFCVTPVGDPPRVGGWKDLWSRGTGHAPQVLVSTGYFFWRFLHSSLLGGVTAMVLIILAKSSQGLEPPISLNIQDFWGGMLVGLLSVHLSRWVMKKIELIFKEDAAESQQ